MRRTAIALALMLAPVVACDSPTRQDQQVAQRVSSFAPDSASTLFRNFYSGYRSVERKVITSQAAWAAEWGLLHGGVTPPPPQPAVDFGEDAVVLASLGERSHGGFNISIDSVVVFDAGVQVVYITSTSPGSNCFTTDAINFPVHVVRVPRPVNNVVFAERSNVTAC